MRVYVLSSVLLLLVLARRSSELYPPQSQSALSSSSWGSACLPELYLLLVLAVYSSLYQGKTWYPCAKTNRPEASNPEPEDMVRP